MSTSVVLASARVHDGGHHPLDAVAGPAAGAVGVGDS